MYSSVRSRNISLVSMENGNISMLHVNATTSAGSDDEELYRERERVPQIFASLSSYLASSCSISSLLSIILNDSNITLSG